MSSFRPRFEFASPSVRRFRGAAVALRLLAVLALAIAVLVPVGSTAFAATTGGWHHVGTGPSGTTSLNGTVNALNADKPGVLLAGGTFTNAGGKANADHIAAWNGTAWNALGPGLGGAVRAIAYHDGKIYAGGVFQNAGGNLNADFLAVWNGVSWAPFCNPIVPGPAFTAEVDALQIVANTLFVGGSFQNGAGIASADGLLACELTAGEAMSPFEAPGDGTGTVYALTATNDGTLYAGGTFLNLAGNPNADFVAAMAFTGGWDSLGTSPITGFVRSLASDGTNVFIGTDAVNVAGIPQADHVVRWDGSTFSALGGNTAGDDGWFPATAVIYGMTVHASHIFVTGSFQNANGDPLADNVAYFTGGHWRHIGSDGAGNGPWIGDGNALAAFHNQLHAGGGFTSAGGDTKARGIAFHWLLRPDARIGTSFSGPFVGNDVYSSTAAGETKTISVARGNTRTLFLNLQHDGIIDEVATPEATGSATGFSVKYFFGNEDVTSQIKNGGLGFGFSQPGDSFTIRMVVKLSKTSANVGSFLVKLKSQPGGPAPDAVRAIVKAT
jgi:hypothetical protein